MHQEAVLHSRKSSDVKPNALFRMMVGDIDRNSYPRITGLTGSGRTILANYLFGGNQPTGERITSPYGEHRLPWSVVSADHENKLNHRCLKAMG